MGVVEIARRSVATPEPVGKEPESWRLEALKLRSDQNQMAIILAKLTHQLTRIAGGDYQREHAEDLAESAYWLQQLCFRLQVPLPHELLRHRLRVNRQNL